MVMELSATLVERMILRLLARSDGAILLLGRLVAVERRGAASHAVGRARRRPIARAGFRAAPGRKTSTWPVRPRLQISTFQRGGNLLFQRRRRVRRVLDLERILPAFGAQDAGAAQILGDRRGVAEWRTSRPGARSGRRVRWRRRSRASARSPSRWRSWNSSRMTMPARSRFGSERRRRVSTPSVRKRRRVRGPGDLFEADLVADRLAHGSRPVRRRHSGRPGARPDGGVRAPGSRDRWSRAGRAARGWSCPRRAALPGRDGVGTGEVCDDFGQQRIDGEAHASFYCRNLTMFWRMISACG